ncbi:MAG: hypothetical protein ACI4AH_00725 [Muribaculaceae bacterium]
MITNEDYQLEELENAAVKKSSNAKRAAAAVGLMGAGGAVGYAATIIPDAATDETTETLSEEDLSGVAESGANQVHQPEVKQQPQQSQQQTSENNSGGDQSDVDLEFTKTTHFVDENGNIFMSVEDGELNGTKISLVDTDGDGMAEYLGYDINNNNIIEADEIMELNGADQIAMGNNSSTPDIVVIDTTPDEEPIVEPEHNYPIDINEEKGDDISGIENDFEDEKTGESYKGDYADNNDNYNNKADVYAYDESNESDNDDLYAYDEDAKDESDYDESEDEDYAMNDDSNDSYDDFGGDTVELA